VKQGSILKAVRRVMVRATAIKCVDLAWAILGHKQVC
jgi:hypothetical protein